MKKIVLKLISGFLVISIWECSKTIYQFTKGYMDYKPKAHVKDAYERPESYLFKVK
ncbi:hypothetical protein [Staphylococcus equorum]|nr:hypothetical protein [Staphylococcus equorum]MDK9853836.1 hypothetical protein [Staphylococcus equorum]